MAAMRVRDRPRDKKGFFRSRKEIKRRELSAEMCKRRARDVEVVVRSNESSDESENRFELQGRRIVELGVLAKELDGGCESCGAPLQLSNCAQETVSGLGSFLYINCNNSDCGEMNVCLTNKTHRSSGIRGGRPIFDVNTKLAAGRFKMCACYSSIFW